MKDVLRIGCIAGFVVLGLAAAWREQTSPAAHRRAVNAFLVYTLLTSFGAGLLQRDLWPFSNWPLVAGIQRPVVQQPRLVAVDRLGTEQAVDYRAWQPFVSDELLAWADGRFFKLGPADRDKAADFLVELSEHNRQQATREKQVGSFDRFWGPLSAPYFLLHPRVWSSSATVPPQPLVGLRLYREKWNIEERARTPQSVERLLVYEYRRP